MTERVRAGATGLDVARRPDGADPGVLGGRGRHMLITALGSLATPLAAFAAAPLLARGLGVAGLGEFTAVTAPLMLLIAIATFGVPEAVAVTVAERPGCWRLALANGAGTLIVIGAVGCLAVGLGADLIAGGNPTVAMAIRLVAWCALPTVVIGVLRGVASGLQRWTLVAADRGLVAIVRFGVVAVAFAGGWLSVEVAAATVALAPLAGALAYLRLPRVAPSAVRTERRSGPASVRGLLGYGWRVWLGAAAGVLLMRLDQVLLAPLAGVFALGLYALATNIAEAVLLANSAVREVTATADAADRSDDLLTGAARTSLLASAAIGAVVVASLPLWFTAVFGADFAAGVPVAAILVLGGVLGVPGSVAGAGLSARRRPELRSLSMVVALVVSTGALVLLAPAAGAVGAAWATLIGNVIAGGLNLVHCRRLYGLNPVDFLVPRRGDLAVLLRPLRRRGVRR